MPAGTLTFQASDIITTLTDAFSATRVKQNERGCENKFARQ